LFYLWHFGTASYSGFLIKEDGFHGKKLLVVKERERTLHLNKEKRFKKWSLFVSLNFYFCFTVFWKANPPKFYFVKFGRANITYGRW
jgi:hypothetical protein